MVAKCRKSRAVTTGAIIVSLGKGDSNAKIERGGLGTTTSIGEYAVV